MVITCFSLQARAVLSSFTILEPLGWKGLVEVTTRQMCEPPASEGDSHCPRHPCPPTPSPLALLLQPGVSFIGLQIVAF